jgi:hypothetical protein
VYGGEPTRAEIQGTMQSSIVTSARRTGGPVADAGRPCRAMAFALPSDYAREISMLYTIAVVLIILWALGLVTSVTMGGFIHALLVIAIIVVLLRVIGGRSPL